MKSSTPALPKSRSLARLWTFLSMWRFAGSVSARSVAFSAPHVPPPPPLILRSKSGVRLSQTITAIWINPRCTGKSQRCSMTAQARTSDSSDVRVATYNVLGSHLAKPSWFSESKAEDLDASARLNRVKAKLQSEVDKGSVLCLQEISLEWSGDLHVFFVQRGYTVVVTSYGQARNNYMGVALAWPTAKYEALTVDIRRVTETRTWGRQDTSPTLNDSPVSARTPEERGRPRLLEPIKAVLSKLMGAGRAQAVEPNEVDRAPEKARSEDDEKYRHWSIAERRFNQALFARLRLKRSELTQNTGVFCVGTYHMPCVFSVPSVMAIHTSMVVKHLAQLAGSDPLVFAGDFNFTPSSESYKLATEGDLPTSSPDFPHRPEWEQYWSAATGARLTSAYKIINGREPDFTNHAQIKDLPLFVETLDYIFYRGGIKPTEVLPLMHRDEVKTTLPMETEPSDHLLLAAGFKLDNKS